MRCIRHRSGGFTFVEVMVSVVLMALLMAAVGVAVHASTTNFRENEDMVRAITTARQALMRITTDLRSALDVSEADPAGQCTILRNDGAGDYTIVYRFDDATDTLHFVDPSGASHVLCRNVTGITFTRTPAAGPARNVRISITVSSGNYSKTVSAAAVIRRNV